MKIEYSKPIFEIISVENNCVLLASGIGVDEDVDYIDDIYGW